MLRVSKILSAIRAGHPAKLAMLGHYIPPFIAYCASYGYDGIWLDLEHRAFDAREVQSLLAFCHLYDLDCLVRPASRDQAVLYRYLEDGASGLVIPHVNTVEDARMLVKAVKFPPVGNRGTNGRGLEADFGLSAPRDQLVNHALRETFLVVQVESPEALANINEIAQVEGVDGFFGGGGDYTIRANTLPEAERIPYNDAMQWLATVCREHGKFWGTMAANQVELAQWHAWGDQLLMWGVDVDILQDALRRMGVEVAAVAESPSR
jgi:2-keto-3-deoxy-L-rhamnonate aldolase RhmA